MSGSTAATIAARSVSDVGSGSCATCSSGGTCTPTNPCHTGTLTCTTGAPTCSDSGANQPDGTSCGTNLVCKAGSCNSCTAGQACQPTNPCKTGTTSCATGASVCAETGNKGQGTLCGAGQSCSQGILTLPAMCNASGTCAAATMQCPSGCNTAGTDCATCPSGQTSCPAGCKDLVNDPTNCGGCGTVCPSPAAGTGIPVCINQSCNIKCNSGYMECAPASLATCQQVTWDFEDMTLEGFRVLNSPSAAGKLGYTSVVQHSGKYALGAIINASSTTSRGYQIGPPICANRGFVQGKGLTVTAWMMIAPIDDKQTFGKASYWGIRITTESGDTLAKGAPRGYNEWFPVSVTAPAGDTQLSAIILEGVFSVDVGVPLSDWTGTMYFDDISVTVP